MSNPRVTAALPASKRWNVTAFAADCIGAAPLGKHLGMDRASPEGFSRALSHELQHSWKHTRAREASPCQARTRRPRGWSILPGRAEKPAPKIGDRSACRGFPSRFFPKTVDNPGDQTP
ncbi:hypothetical protein ACVWXM_007723 [Bradyrhizobium sp. GM7.3]